MSEQQHPSTPAVRITYCAPCGYLSQATSLAERLLFEFEERLSGGVALIPGRDGIFEVRHGDRLLFSKRQTGRFPAEGEIEDMLGEAMGR